MGGGSEIIFPANIQWTDDLLTGNTNNYNIIRYLIKNYPDMIINRNGKYTPIVEEINIINAPENWSEFNGKVIGIANLNISDPRRIALYTQDSIKNFYGLAVAYEIDGNDIFQLGGTYPWFTDM